MTLKSSGRADFAQISINQFFDRNPLTVDQNYQSQTAPHAQTVRWTYTVPANRKAFVSNVIAYCLRYAVATAAADIICFVKRSGTYMAWAQLTSADNTVGNRDKSTSVSTVTALPGEVISAATQDASTGGQSYFTMMANITEFDA